MTTPADRPTGRRIQINVTRTASPKPAAPGDYAPPSLNPERAPVLQLCLCKCGSEDGSGSGEG